MTERANQGYDTVISSVSNTLPANVEQLQLLGAGLTGKGNNSANTIFGDGTSSNTLYGLGGDDYIVAGSDNDTIHGGDDDDTIDGGAGNDVLTGDDGDDVLVGGAGKDKLPGGAGADRFVYQALSDSPVGAGRDIITDFTPGTDVIDVSAIDANTKVAGQQGFTFIGDSAFGHQAGQLQYSYIGNSTIVTGDVDGNGTADFQIQLSGHLTLTASDFDLGGDSPSNASTNHQLTSAIAAFDSGLPATPAPPSSSSGTSSNPVNLAISPV